MKKILIIVRRLQGDVLLATPLINILHKNWPAARIDLLVNDDTLPIARTLMHIDSILSFSYDWQKQGFSSRMRHEIGLLKKIFKKYDLAISLTANERSSFYAGLAGRCSIGISNKDTINNLWKNFFLTHTVPYKEEEHIVCNNIEALKPLGIKVDKAEVTVSYSKKAAENVAGLLARKGIKDFLIFHPAARYEYKVYPAGPRKILLEMLNDLGVPIIITGGRDALDLNIAEALPVLPNIHSIIGQTSLEDFIALTDKSLGFIGMDTLNMHIAAALNKRIFAIFGPTLPDRWSPWSNTLQRCANVSQPLQTYGNVMLFQADMSCVACGLAGCDDQNGISKCLGQIPPEIIFKEIREWLNPSA